MADLARLVDDLSALSVIEAAQLSKMLEEKWGVSAAAPVAVAAAGGGAAAAAPEAAVEKTEFDVILAAIGEKKINVIVSQTFPLWEAKKAQDQVATGHTRGKIVLRVRNGAGTFERRQS